MKKEWFFDRYCGQQFVALLEDGKLAEFAAEKETGGEIVGNIYKGRVMNVLSRHAGGVYFLRTGTQLLSVHGRNLYRLFQIRRARSAFRKPVPWI